MIYFKGSQTIIIIINNKYEKNKQNAKHKQLMNKQTYK